MSMPRRHLLALNTVRRMIVPSVCLSLVGCVSAAQLPPGAATVRVVPDEAARRVDVLVDGAPFTSYIFPESLKKPVLYPLRTASGAEVTRGFPLDPRPGERVDHPHHVGLWFNYGDVNGIDFWNNSHHVPPDRAPRMGSVLHREIRAARGGSGEGVLEVTMEWVDHQGTPLLREDTRFVFRASGQSRGIDRVTTLTALDRPVRLSDNKEGMLGLRVARALEHPVGQPVVLTDGAGRPTAVPVLDNAGVTGRYLSSEGLEGDDVWGTRARWTALSGEIDGERVTIAIFDHPENVGYPTYWHARGYGLFAANPLGQREFSEGREVLDYRLAAGESTTFRHRLLIHSGAVPADEMEVQYRLFEAGR
jgi:hypothetical protein